MGQTILKYGELEFRHVVLQSFAQTPQFDDSGTVTHSRFSIAILGTLHAQVQAVGGNAANGSGQAILPIDPSSYGTSAARVYSAQQRALIAKVGVNRAPLTLWMGCHALTGAGGVPILRIAKHDGELGYTILDPGGPLDGFRKDVGNGPRCTSFRILYAMAESVWQVAATFEAEVSFCDNEDNGLVVSNTWSVTEGWDENRFTTFAYTGVLRVASAEININTFRDLIIPTTPHMMKLASLNMSTDPTGLNMRYHVVFREANHAAPHPATSWQVEHTESFDAGNVSQGQCSVTLTGPRNAQKSELIVLAHRILLNRLVVPNDAIPENQGLIVDAVRVVDVFGDSGPTTIAMSMAVTRRLFAGGPQNGGANHFPPIKRMTEGFEDELLDMAGNTYDRDRSRGAMGHVVADEIDPPVTLTQLFLHKLMGGCEDPDQFGIGADEVREATRPASASYPVTPEVSEGIVPFVDDVRPPYVSAKNEDGVYTLYRVESTYEQDFRRVTVPIAEPLPAPSSSSSSSPPEPQPTHVSFKLGPTTTRRRIVVRAERVGLPPELPRIVEQYQVGGGSGQNPPPEYKWFIDDKAIVRLEPVMGADGRKIVVAQVELVYAADRLVDLTTASAIDLGPLDWSHLPAPPVVDGNAVFTLPMVPPPPPN